MPFTRPVFWYSGQFLEPQHFQQSDCHYHDQAAFMATLARPWPWGVNNLEIDEVALASGLIRITQADLLFPDGTRAVVAPSQNEGNAVIETRSFDQAWTDRHKSFTIQVGLAKIMSKDNVAGVLPMVGTSQDTLPATIGRFMAANVDDMTTDRYALPHPSLATTGAPVRTLYYYLRLFWPEESRLRGDHHFFPLLRLKDQGLGARLDPDWCPPLTRILADPKMFKMAQGFEARLTSLISHLAPLRPTNLYDQSTGSIINLLSTATQTLSELRFILTRPDSQCWELFALLRRGLSAMSASLQIDNDLASLSASLPFDPNSPLSSLKSLKAPYQKLLASVLPEVVAEALFTIKNDFLLARLPREATSPNLEPFLVINFDAPMAELLAEGRLLVGTPEDIHEALTKAVPALPVELVEAPTGLPKRPGFHYLKLDRCSAAWSRVVKRGKLAFIILSDQTTPPASLVAYSKIICLKAARRSTPNRS